MRLRVLIALVLGMCLLPLGMSPTAAQAQPSPHPFEIVSGSFHVTPSTDQAGAHENLTVAFDFAHEQNKHERTYNDVKDTVVNLPAGFAGNNTAVPTCTAAQLLGGSLAITECPPDTQVGTISFTLDPTSLTPIKTLAPIYNMEVISPGVTAMLGFRVLAIVQNLPVTVRPGDTGITVTSPSIFGTGEFHDISVTTWGVPASHEHDTQRGETCGVVANPDECTLGDEEVNIPAKPFLSNPTSCGPFSRRCERTPGSNPNTGPKREIEVAPTVVRTRPLRPLDRSEPDNPLRGISDGTGCLAARPADMGKSVLSCHVRSSRTLRLRCPKGSRSTHGRVRSRCMHPGAVRGRDLLLAARRRLPPGIKDRLDRNRNAATGGKNPRRGLCRYPLRQSVQRTWAPERVAAGAVCRREGPRSGDHHQSRGAGQTEPGDGAARHNVR